MPTTSIAIGIAPNCTFTVNPGNTWSSVDNIIGNGTYGAVQPLFFEASDVFFNPGSASGRINSATLRMTFSIGIIDAPLIISPFSGASGDHPAPCQAFTPVTSDQWDIDAGLDGFDIGALSGFDLGIHVDTTVPTTTLGAFAITDYRIDIDYDQFVVSSITPKRGFEGTPVVIKGAGFVSGISVEFDGVPADNIVYVDSTTITADAPAHANGYVDVLVSNGFAPATFTNGFRYGSQIDSVSLSHGAPFGDSLVNITGIGFELATITNILFGTEEATQIHVLNDSNVSCHTPAHALGSVFITIEFDSGPDIVSDVALFTYIEESFTLEVASPDEEGETEPIEWVEPVEVGDEITISSEDEEVPLDLTEILTLELVPVDGGTPISITINTQTEEILTFSVPTADPGIYVIVGTTFTGSVILGTLQILLIGNASGVYTLVPNKTNDTIYNNARDGTTQDVRIPTPKIRTGFIGG